VGTGGGYCSEGEVGGTGGGVGAEGSGGGQGVGACRGSGGAGGARSILGACIFSMGGTLKEALAVRYEQQRRENRQKRGVKRAELCQWGASLRGEM